MTRTPSFVKRAENWIDNSPRKGWYFAGLLAFNFAWDIVGHWPL